MSQTKENLRKHKMRELNRLTPISVRVKNFVKRNRYKTFIWFLRGLIAVALVVFFCFIGYKVYENTTKFTIKEIRCSHSASLADLYDNLSIKQGDKLNDLDIQALTKQLSSNPRVRSAKVTLILPDILDIDIRAHIPIVYVEMENALFHGKRERYFLSDRGVLFSVDEKYHRDFLNSPVWYLQKDDIKEFALGKEISKESLATIIELITAVNRHELLELPMLKEIFRPKEWKFKLNFEGGSEVIVQSYDIEEQINRLVMIFDHARNSSRHIRSANVIPKNNPAVIFYPSESNLEPNSTKADK